MERNPEKFLFVGSGIDPFYRYGGHIESVKFKEYHGMPRGHEHDPIYSLSTQKMVTGKKIVVTCLDVIMIAFSPRNIH